ncbi:MAG: monovalent cation/H(+) antiporter subunit G [Candidatus Nezhaarchaeales archaeon]
MEGPAPLLSQALLLLGMALVAVGAFCDLVSSIGLLRFPNFFVRLHAATVGTIGGAAYPLVGVALMATACDFLGPTGRWFIVAGSILTSLIIVLTSPAGSHALARGAHRFGVPVEPKVCDLLEEDKGRRG